MKHEQVQLALELHKKKIKPEAIAATLTRRYGSIITAL